MGARMDINLKVTETSIGGESNKADAAAAAAEQKQLYNKHKTTATSTDLNYSLSDLIAIVSEEEKHFLENNEPKHLDKRVALNGA
ncbi:hypothetical protein RUM43_001959 [Polyplax serrata]|uniref:Uncharacterized protein n=1 Tax=Polyplax serrata TaxID=468196 RepID=A0AAN8S467_POLSC